MLGVLSLLAIAYVVFRPLAAPRSLPDAQLRRPHVGDGRPLELDEQKKAFEVGGPVASQRRQVVRLGIHRLGVLAGGRVEMDSGDVLRQLVELVEQFPQALRPHGADRAAATLGEVARAGEELVPLPPSLLGVGREVAEIPANAACAEG